MSKGLAILREQIWEQILPDGMQFELAPGYHCRTTYVMAMLIATGHTQLRDLVANPLQRMVNVLDYIAHPDGGVSLLNDSAFGIYNEPRQIASFCQQHGSDEHRLESSIVSGCFALPDAGYYGWKDRKGNYIICDFGKIGPDYIPAHAHADMFSFELSLKGYRVVVDTGVHDYEISDTRRYARSTEAHNTVEIEGQDQCEMWAAFRVARRGYPRDVQWSPGKSSFSISGWHDGYRRLPGKPLHSRSLEWKTDKGLRIVDRIRSSRPVTVVSRFHLHPSCKVILSGEDRIELVYPKGRLEMLCPDESRVTVQDGWYFPQFGVRERNKVIAIEREGRDIELITSIHSLA